MHLLAPLKTPIRVRLNTADHPAPYVYIHNGEEAHIVGISEGGDELGFNCDVRLANGLTVWLAFDLWLDLIDLSSVPVSHSKFGSVAATAWVLTEAARNAWKGNYYSRHYQGEISRFVCHIEKPQQNRLNEGNSL